MSRREDIDTGIYSDPDFTQLSPVARSVYIWSWTNSHCGMSGIYKLDRRLIEFETGWPAEQLVAALDELQAREMVFYDGRVVYVKARVKNLRTKSPNIAKSIARDLEHVGLDHPYVHAFMDRYGDVDWIATTFADLNIGTPLGTPHETPSEPLEPLRNPLQGVQGTDKGKGKKGGAGGKRRAPAPPPPDAVPDDLSAALHPVAVAAHTVLCRVAAAKGAKPVTLAAVGRAVASYPDHDHGRIAPEFEHWWVHGNGATRTVVDVVATYRNRLRDLPAPPAGATVHQHPTAAAPDPSNVAAYVAARNAAEQAVHDQGVAAHRHRLEAAQQHLKATTPPTTDLDGAA